KTADGKQVRAAFRALALKLHPDKAGPELGADSAARLFALCAEAHAVLGSAERRSAYDAALSALDELGQASDAEASAKLLLVVLCNVLKEPGAARYRHVKLSSPRVQAGIVKVPGALELLWACGFVPIADSPASAPEEAVLVEDAPLEPLETAVRRLRELVELRTGSSAVAAAPPASPAASRASSAAAPQQPTWEPACDRRTSVLIPRAVEQSLPTWFFERAGAEIKAAFREAVRRREDSQVLRTRAMRERAESHKGRPVDHSTARVRVRFPEGVFLQGEFRGGEPVAEVMAWVAAALHDPLHTFDLVRPDRQALSAGMGSVKKAQLTPSAVLNFQWTGESAALMKTVPALRRELLVAAQADGSSGV
ncbi:hypothetical protein H632_c1687p0, partial [Helicosporidium sp. ATCC 50920]